MKTTTFKVFYTTSEGKSFKTIVPVSTKDEVMPYMFSHYNMIGVTVTTSKPSVKQKYAHYTNVRVK